MNLDAELALIRLFISVAIYRQSYWEVQVDITTCHYYYQFGSCVVYFSVCGELPASICGSGNAVCQVAFSQDRKSNRSFVLGKASTESIQPLS